MSEQWFYNRKDGYGVQGPFDLSHLANLLQEGELAPNHEVRCGVIGQWSSAEDMKWYYNGKDGGGVHGPVTRVQLQEFLDAELISEKAEARSGWSDEWQPLPVVLGLVAAASGEVKSTPDVESDDDFELNLDEDEESVTEDQQVLDADVDEDIKPDDDAWYCEISGQVQGPLPWSRVHSLASMGRMNREDHIRHGSQRDWKTAADFVGLFPKPSTEPAPTVEQPAQPESAPQPVTEAETPQNEEQTPPSPPAATPAKELPAVDSQQRDKLAEWLNDEVGEPEPPVNAGVSAFQNSGQPASGGPSKSLPTAKQKSVAKSKSRSRSLGLGDFFSSRSEELRDLFKSPLMMTLLGVIVLIALIYGVIAISRLTGSQNVAAHPVYQEFWEKFKTLRQECL